ncbi:MAG: hypothetical protein K6W08_10885, partial [Firmicutes bacterium]|nr:hypothetical protein [Bacillota bacterium]
GTRSDNKQPPHPHRAIRSLQRGNRVVVFHQAGFAPDGSVQGRHVFTGIRPRFYDRFKPIGIDLPVSLFLR